MEEMVEEVPEIRLCEVSNEVEAAMVVNLLREEDICRPKRRHGGHDRLRRPAVRVRARHLRPLFPGKDRPRDPRPSILISRT